MCLSVDLFEGCNEFVEKCIQNGAQRLFSAAIEFANDLRAEFWFLGVSRV